MKYEAVERKEARPIETKNREQHIVRSTYSMLRGYNLERDDGEYVESDLLRELIGFSENEVLRLLDDEFGTDYSDTVETLEYGNGWALLEFE